MSFISSWLNFRDVRKKEANKITIILLSFAIVISRERNTYICLFIRNITYFYFT